MEELPVLSEPLTRRQAQGVPYQRKPEWLKVQMMTGPNFTELKDLMRGLRLNTVCEEARCPNIFECWEHRTATFMILGAVCTRACGFCAVTSGNPGAAPDAEEPQHLAAAVAKMGLRHVVITSVARDDLDDGGAAQFAACIRAVRAVHPDCTIETLIPDFQGNWDALQLVMDARPNVLNHNVETVRRLTPRVRSKATYDRTMELLRRAREMQPDIPTKSSLMLGLGETKEEVLATMDDLRAAGCEIMTIGQYLQPSHDHLRLVRYIHPDEFAELKREGLKRGFKHVESGPLVRSSYHAHEQASAAGAVPGAAPHFAFPRTSC